VFASASRSAAGAGSGTSNDGLDFRHQREASIVGGDFPLGLF